MKRVIHIPFLCCFFMLVLFFGLPSYAQTDEVPVANIDQLNFIPRYPDPALAVASAGDLTWIRGRIPDELLGLPVVFQIPSARIHGYRLYLRQDHLLRHIPEHTNSRSVHFKSRFPQYAFVPTDSLFYVAIRGRAPETLRIRLEERTQFASTETFRLFRIGGYYGLAVMSVIFNLVFYLIFRDNRFITYSILLFTTFLSFFYEDGMFYYFSDGRWTMDYLLIWNNAVSAIVAVPFTYYFLDLQRDHRHLKKWFFLGSAIMLAGAFVHTLTDNAVSAIFVYALCFLFPTGCLYVAIRRFRQDVYARFLAIIFSLVVLTGLLYVLYSRVNPSAYAWFDINTFRLVSAIEIISISFAIIFKVRALQQENDHYREALSTYLNGLAVTTAERPNITNGHAKELPTVSSKNELANTLKRNYELTEREIDVLLCLWDGLTNKEIAERLFITVSTTKYHVSNLYLKLDVKNRNQAQVLRKALWTPTQPE